MFIDTRKYRRLCMASGVECYQDGLHSEQQNMSLEDFRKIAEQCKGKTYQFALGGCGDPDQHEEFEKILQICREYQIVPNFTTDNQEQCWAVDLNTHTIKEAWDSMEFENFRMNFRKSCPDCDKRRFCMGECPIRPEIALCEKIKK